MMRYVSILAVAFVTVSTVPALAQSNTVNTGFLPPTVFQAAGPTVTSIQGSVDQYRAALGTTNNGNALGPLANGRREINWDGGGSTATAIAGTPFIVFLVTRGPSSPHRGRVSCKPHSLA